MSVQGTVHKLWSHYFKINHMQANNAYFVTFDSPF